MRLIMAFVPRFLNPGREHFFLLGPRGTGKTSWCAHQFPNALRIDLLDPATLRPLSARSEEHTSELQSQSNLVCRLLLEKKNKDTHDHELFWEVLMITYHGASPPRSCKSDLYAQRMIVAYSNYLTS